MKPVLLTLLYILFSSAAIANERTHFYKSFRPDNIQCQNSIRTNQQHRDILSKLEKAIIRVSGICSWHNGDLVTIAAPTTEAVGSPEGCEVSGFAITECSIGGLSGDARSVAREEKFLESSQSWIQLGYHEPRSRQGLCIGNVFQATSGEIAEFFRKAEVDAESQAKAKCLIPQRLSEWQHSVDEHPYCYDGHPDAQFTAQAEFSCSQL